MEDYNNYYQGGEQNPYNSPIPEQKSNKKIWLLIFIPIFILIIGVLVFFIFNSSSKTISDNEIPEIYIQKIYESTCVENWDCGDWSSCSEQGSQTRTCTDSNSCGTTTNKPFEQQSCIPQLQTINCGSNVRSLETLNNQPNFDCFIDASENCEPAKLLDISTIKLFGMLITTSINMELKGMENNKCIYYQKTINQTIAFTDEMIQQMLDGGATQEEIDQQEQTANENAKLVWGLEKTCKFNQEDLTILLNNWKEGSSSTEDFDVAECE